MDCNVYGTLHDSKSQVLSISNRQRYFYKVSNETH